MVGDAPIAREVFASVVVRKRAEQVRRAKRKVRHRENPEQATRPQTRQTRTPPSNGGDRFWRRRERSRPWRNGLPGDQASLSSVDASTIARGEILSRSQALEQERIAQVQEQLGEQRAKLLEMQEEARRAGMHTQVYDP